MKQELLDKYNVPVPRYTSYPPANYFHDGFTSRDYADAIRESNRQQPESVSFYFHIPFCQRLCHYCGCNSYAAPKPEIIDRYVAALHKEIDLILPLLDKKRKVSQIHYGGGTPTFLPALELKELNAHVSDTFELIENPEKAIECHPGWMTGQDWEKLATAGFNRFSIGIQDFNKQVLQTVHRQVPLLQPEEIVTILRSCGVRINMDFLYGLPHQTEASFAETIEKAVSLKPDRLVTFSYAHVPWAFPRQKVLEKTGLPSGDEKSRMFEAARKILCGLPADRAGSFRPQRRRVIHSFAERTTTSQFPGILHAPHNRSGLCFRRDRDQPARNGLRPEHKRHHGVYRESRSRHLACRQRISPEPGGTDHTGGNRNVDVQLPDRLERTVGTAFRPRPLHQAGNRL